jgi:hypothetical protein
VLAALPLRDYLSLLDDLEPVTLAYGAVLYEPGELIGHVYFPNQLPDLLAGDGRVPAGDRGHPGR